MSATQESIIDSSGQKLLLVTEKNTRWKKVVAKNDYAAIPIGAGSGGKRHPLSLNAMKLLMIAIAQCGKDDKEFYHYSIRISEIAKLFRISPTNLYKNAVDLSSEVFSAVLYQSLIDDKDPNGYHKDVHIFDSFEYHPKLGYIDFQLSRSMEKYFLEVGRNFFSIGLFAYMSMRSTYSIILWNYLRAAVKKNRIWGKKPEKVEMSLQQLRMMTGTEDKFKMTADLRRNVIDVAVSDINSFCHVDVRYETVKEGRRITGFRFLIESEKNAEIREFPKEFVEKTRLKALLLYQKQRPLTVQESQDLEAYRKKYPEI